MLAFTIICRKSSNVLLEPSLRNILLNKSLSSLSTSPLGPILTSVPQPSLNATYFPSSIVTGFGILPIVISLPLLSTPLIINSSFTA